MMSSPMDTSKIVSSHTNEFRQPPSLTAERQVIVIARTNVPQSGTTVKSFAIKPLKSS